MSLKPKAFRPDTWDENIFNGIVNLNEYGIGTYIDKSIVIDIGTHIGSFTVLSKMRGAEKVYAYEAYKDNYEFALKNTEGLDGVLVSNQAVTRSDKKIERLNFARCSFEQNTGGGSVFTENSPVLVEAISLDEILGQIGQTVELLKLDCEGSEFPILFTCTKLNQIKIILGEYHNFNGLDKVPEALRVEGIERYDISSLHDFLTLKGFRGGWTPDKENLGKFRYVRKH